MYINSSNILKTSAAKRCEVCFGKYTRSCWFFGDLMYIYKFSNTIIFEHNSILVFCWYSFRGKVKLLYIFQETLYNHFVEPINWRGLCLSYNWIMQSLNLCVICIFKKNWNWMVFHVWCSAFGILTFSEMYSCLNYLNGEFT